MCVLLYASKYKEICNDKNRQRTKIYNPYPQKYLVDTLAQRDTVLHHSYSYKIFEFFAKKSYKPYD